MKCNASYPSGELHEHESLGTVGRKARVKTAAAGEDLKIMLEVLTAVSSGM